MTRSRDTANIIPTVDAKGDLLVGTADNTVDNLSPGTNGQVLTANSATGTGLEWTTPASTGNLIINGAMQVAQRGTSATEIIGSGYFTADRFALSLSSLGTWTQTVENDGPAGSGLTKSLKLLCTTANNAPDAGSFFSLTHLIEGQNLQSIKKGTANAEQLTVSFWVKSNVTGNYICHLRDQNNTRIASIPYTLLESNTWEKKTIVFPADTVINFNNDNSASLRLGFYLAVGSNFTSGTLQTTWGPQVQENIAVGQVNLAAATNNFWQITGVQLEVGTVATPFQFQDIQKELAACQRYYVRWTGQSATSVGAGLSTSATEGYASIQYPVQMRVNPTSVDFSSLVFSDNATYDRAVSSIGIQLAGPLSINIGVNFASGASTYRPGMLKISGSGFLGLSAEL
jgi:hypothetical protein